MSRAPSDSPRRSPPWRRWLGLTLVMIVGVVAYRHFVALGYLFPVRIAGDSMYPTLLGDHFRFVCAHCHFAGSASAAGGDSAPVRCWHCRADAEVSLRQASAQRVIVDRMTWRCSGCQRGDIIAFHEPGSRRLAVKRVVGIPGDHVVLRNGVLIVNGAPWLGPTRLLLDDDAYHQEGASLWRGGAGSGWQHVPPGHQLPSAAAEMQWLTWTPREDQRLDDVGFNHHVPRALHEITCIELSGRIQVEGHGNVVLRYQIDDQTYDARYDVAAGKLHFPGGTESDFRERSFSFELARRPDKVHFRCGTHILHTPVMSAGAGNFAIGGAGVQLRVEELIVRRPIYVAADSSTAFAWQLQATDYFVLGDNTPVSRDSRHYGVLRADAILGLVRKR